MTRRDLTKITLDKLPPGEWVDEAAYRFSYLRLAVKDLRSALHGNRRLRLLRVSIHEIGDRHCWEIGFPTLMQAFGESFQYALWFWKECESSCTQIFIAELLAHLKAKSLFLTGAGILALLVSLLELLIGILSTFDRQVERISGQVLAPGGQTALFAPLT